MAELTIRYDDYTDNEIQKLKNYWNLKDEAEVISKSIAMLRLITAVDSTDGDLVARKGAEETRILLS
jgi:hypothetical protein